MVDNLGGGDKKRTHTRYVLLMYGVERIVLYSAISNCITIFAEWATEVPGPKMAATPAL